MNRFFVRAIFNELELLKENSWNNINSILKKYDDQRKKYDFEFKYADFFKKVVFNDITEKEINNFLKLKYKKGKVSDYINVEKNEKENSFSITNKSNDEAFDVDKNIPMIDKIRIQFRTFTHNPIINLITLYESFIRQLISFDCYDGDYDVVKNETISFERLISLGYEKEEIKNYIIKSYCDNKLYGEKKRIIEIISTLKIDCNDCQEIIDAFNEVYFRRNMYVHSVCEITNDYKTLPSSILKKWTINAALIDSPQYLNHAFDTVYKVFLMILIKKYLFKEEKEENLFIIEQVLYEEIYIKGLYSVACFGYEQLKKLKWISKTDRYIFFINYMHCLKRTKDEELSKELLNWNTDTDANIYKLAKKLIENDYKDINILINKVLKEQKEYEKIPKEEKYLYILKEDIEKWPLFEDYRQTEEYKLLKQQK